MPYAGVVYTAVADAQLQALIDQDIRYQLEPEEYEWLLLRDPKGLGTLREVEGEPVYIFVTAAKRNGPPKLAITYRIVDDSRQFVQIVDIRPRP